MHPLMIQCWVVLIIHTPELASIDIISPKVYTTPPATSSVFSPDIPHAAVRRLFNLVLFNALNTDKYPNPQKNNPVVV